jgi:glycosyltransferase involved in cell wall biosynthesis
MKILIDFFNVPFYLAHGGAQTQVMETISGLREIGVDVELARWWDGKQSADIIHAFGVPNMTYINFAREKHIPIVNTTLFTATCNRSKKHLSIQGLIISSLLKLPSIPPWGSIRSQLIWETFKACDMNIVGLEAEAHVLQTVYGVPREKISIVPLGLTQPFLETSPGTDKNNYLITTGTITDRKKSLELARMALLAKVPICFVGKPYDTSSAYWREFQSLVDGTIITHIPHTESIEEMVNLLKGARGYVLFSDYENWCLSAHEAIACGLPILIPDQTWSRELFGNKAKYFSGWDIESNSKRLLDFHDDCPNIRVPDISLYSWKDVASILLPIYEKLIK